MKIEVSEFGALQGEAVKAFTLINDQDMQVTLLNLGGIIKDIKVRDRSGEFKHCVQSFDSLEQYIEDKTYRGAIVGRYANRIGQATFTLDGKQYFLDKNGGDHCLHGGNTGFHKRVWNAAHSVNAQQCSLTLQLTSPDGEGGFPGNVDITACYTLDNNNVLSLSICASTDKSTPLSFTQHAYFTLSNESTVGSTYVKIDADHVTQADSTLLPTGRLTSVTNTPFDYRTLTKIASRVNSSLPCELFEMVGGYDHNYVLTALKNNQPNALVYAEDTGIEMALSTNLPGLQFYTGSLQTSEQIGALCLEPQHFPDAPNRPEFPSCIVEPGKPMTALFRYAFSVD